MFVRRHVSSLFGNGRTQGIAAQPFEPMAMARRSHHAGMQVEAVAASVRPRVRRTVFDIVWRIAEAAHPRPGPRTGKGKALHGRRPHPRQHGRFLRPVVGGKRLIVHAVAAPVEQLQDPLTHEIDHGDHILIGRWRGFMKLKPT